MSNSIKDPAGISDKSLEIVLGGALKPRKGSGITSPGDVPGITAPGDIPLNVKK